MAEVIHSESSNNFCQWFKSECDNKQYISAFSKNETGVWSLVYLDAVHVSIQNFPINNFRGFNGEIDTKQDVIAFSRKWNMSVIYGFLELNEASSLSTLTILQGLMYGLCMTCPQHFCKGKYIFFLYFTHDMAHLPWSTFDIRS